MEDDEFEEETFCEEEIKTSEEETSEEDEGLSPAEEGFIRGYDEAYEAELENEEDIEE